MPAGNQNNWQEDAKSLYVSGSQFRTDKKASFRASRFVFALFSSAEVPDSGYYALHEAQRGG